MPDSISPTTRPTLRLGAHIGQQNMTMTELRATWRRLDERLDWLSIWDHLYEAPPQGGTVDHFEALTTLGALAADTSHARIGCAGKRGNSWSQSAYQ